MIELKRKDSVSTTTTTSNKTDPNHFDSDLNTAIINKMNGQPNPNIKED